MQRFIILLCIFAGDKLQIIGAEISAGAIQKEALEAMRTTFLRIHYNGTHKSASLSLVISLVSFDCFAASQIEARRCLYRVMLVHV